MATGDLKGNLRKIEQGLRLLNYPRDVDYNRLAQGDPSEFLPIISYCFTSFSTHVAELLVEANVELTAKNDLRFIDTVYKLLRDQFQYKPVLSKQQFLQHGFAERKMQIACDIISFVYKKHKEFGNVNKVKSQTKKRIPSIKPVVQASLSAVPDFTTTCAVNFEQKPQVERHKSFLNACIPEDMIHDVLEGKGEGEEGEEENFEEREVTHVADVENSVPEQMLEDNKEMEELKKQVAELQEKINKLNWLEDKLQALEEKLQGKVVINENDWSNLQSRMLLLETQLLLQSRKVDLSADFNNMSEESTSTRNVTPVPPDSEKVELPEMLHQSSGYSSLLSSDPSPKAVVINNHDQSEVSKETTMQRMERISKMIEETSELLKTSSNTS